MTQLLNAIPGALAQGLIWGVMAIGVYITYKVLDIADLTVDGSLCTGAAVCTMLLLAGHSPWIAMLCAVLAGLLAGTVTGLLHVLLGWAAVLVTLLVLFFSTELGCALRATGCNPVMSRAQGVNTGLMKVIGLALSNAVVAMSGGLLCQYQGYTDVNMGRGAVVIGLAAVVIGQAVLGRHGGHMAAQLGGVVLGAVIYYIVYQVIIFAGFDTDLLKMFSAVVVAVFLGVPHIRDQIRTNSRIKKGGSHHAENA